MKRLVLIAALFSTSAYADQIDNAKKYMVYLLEMPGIDGVTFGRVETSKNAVCGMANGMPFVYLVGEKRGWALERYMPPSFADRFKVAARENCVDLPWWPKQ